MIGFSFFLGIQTGLHPLHVFDHTNGAHPRYQACCTRMSARACGCVIIASCPVFSVKTVPPSLRTFSPKAPKPNCLQWIKLRGSVLAFIVGAWSFSACVSSGIGVSRGVIQATSCESVTPYSSGAQGGTRPCLSAL